MSRIIYDGEKIVVDATRINVEHLNQIAEKYNAEFLSNIYSYVFDRSINVILDLTTIEGALWDPSFEDLVNKVRAREERRLKEINDIGLPEKLFPFQKEAVARMLKSERNTLLASDQGTGKTCMSCTYLAYKEDSLPALLVCPASLKTNWQVELQKWAPNLKSFIINGRSSYADSTVIALAKQADVVIINYDILGEDDKEASRKEKERIKLAKENGWKYRKAFIPTKGWSEEFNNNFNFKTVICDECQYIESTKAIRSRAVIQVTKNPKIKKLFLSGTPFETKVRQFYNACHILAPDLFPSESDYLFRYCDPKKNYFGWTFDGLSHVDELRNKLAMFMIRYKKEDVLKQLPPKQKIPVYLDMDSKSRKNYDEMEAELVEQKDGIEQFSYLGKMKQALVDIKIEPVVQFIKDTLEVENKVVVFTYHNSMYESLMKKFAGQCVGINGSTPTLERQPQVVKFQNDPAIKVFVGQIQAASVGLTLTAARTVIFTEWGQTAAQMAQAYDRIHRIGQNADRCIGYYLICKDTIDEDPLVSLEKHNSDIEAVMNGNDNSSMLDYDSLMIAKVKERLLMKKKKSISIEYE